jgi:hypothetical protein
MARVIKIDNAYKKRFEREEKKRAVATREKRVYFLIVCEGEKTEPNYFRELEKQLPIGSVELRVEGMGRNTLGLVEEAIRLQEKSAKKYDRIWAVFDKDDFPDENFNNAIFKAKSKNINCAWSNEAFELWFLLHFQNVSNGMKREVYKGFLEREIQKATGNTEYKYRKNAADTYSLLINYGNLERAKEWADKLCKNYSDERFASHNPCTLVQKLVHELFNPKEVLDLLNIE